MDPLSLLDKSPTSLGTYRVLRHLGSGATADVFEVVEKGTNRSHVLKQMPLANMSDEEKLRAKQEILVMDGVDHPNVVKFHESFSSDTSVDIVMEYCEGGTLEDLIERQRYEGVPFPEDVLIEWMAELLCALAHIHSKRILHRDLKTSNIFVTTKNHLKLGDFGVCTILTNANAKAESMIGTPLYFAPEVCENEAYDEHSDVWSLGIVFYEMCTLRRPFEADNLFSLIQKILTEEIAPFNTGLDQTFEDIVKKMLSKDPKGRPTAQELIDVNLNVPKSHPSHPSQKPSRSRLVQQYYGPELKYKKQWPPPSTDALGKSKSAMAAGTSAGSATAGGKTRADKNGHNDAEAYVTDERDREKYKQLLNQTLGTSRAQPAAGAPLAGSSDGTAKKKASEPSSAPRKASEAKPAKASPPTKLTRLPDSALGNPTKAASSKVISRGSAAPVPDVWGSSLSDALAKSQMDELKMDVARRRMEMFGEDGVPASDEVVVIAIPEGSMKGLDASDVGRHSALFHYSATVRASSSFLDGIAAVLQHHTANGTKIKLEELDDAAQLLNQYKLTNYGLY